MKNGKLGTFMFYFLFTLFSLALGYAGGLYMSLGFLVLLVMLGGVMLPRLTNVTGYLLMHLYAISAFGWGFGFYQGPYDVSQQNAVILASAVFLTLEVLMGFVRHHKNRSPQATKK